MLDMQYEYVHGECQSLNHSSTDLCKTLQQLYWSLQHITLGHGTFREDDLKPVCSCRAVLVHLKHSNLSCGKTQLKRPHLLGASKSLDPMDIGKCYPGDILSCM